MGGKRRATTLPASIGLLKTLGEKMLLKVVKVVDNIS